MKTISPVLANTYRRMLSDIADFPDFYSDLNPEAVAAVTADITHRLASASPSGGKGKAEGVERP